MNSWKQHFDFGGFMKVLLGLVLVLFAVAVGSLFYLGQKSQAGAAPGLQSSQLAACPSSPNCVRSESDTPQEQRVESFPVEIWSQIASAVSDMGGKITRQEEDYIAAEFTSSLFKFTDDVEFRRSDDAVHVRSASRVGHSDLNANKARVEDLRDRLTQR